MMMVHFVPRDMHMAGVSVDRLARGARDAAGEVVLDVQAAAPATVMSMKIRGDSCGKLFFILDF